MPEAHVVVIGVETRCEFFGCRGCHVRIDVDDVDRRPFENTCAVGNLRLHPRDVSRPIVEGLGFEPCCNARPDTRAGRFANPGLRLEIADDPHAAR